MSALPVMGRKHALLILESIARRGSATYYEIGTDLRLLTSRSSLHPVLMLLRDHEPKLLEVSEDGANGVTKYRYSLTVLGEEVLREAQRTRLRENWAMSPQERDFVEVAVGVLRLLADGPESGATIAEKMAIEPSEAVAILRQLRLGCFISIKPDNGQFIVTELGRDFLDGFKQLIEGVAG